MAICKPKLLYFPPNYFSYMKRSLRNQWDSNPGPLGLESNLLPSEHACFGFRFSLIFIFNTYLFNLYMSTFIYHSNTLTNKCVKNWDASLVQCISLLVSLSSMMVGVKKLALYLAFWYWYQTGPILYRGRKQKYLTPSSGGRGLVLVYLCNKKFKNNFCTYLFGYINRVRLNHQT